MKDVVQLRAWIQEQFDSETQAARELGWTRQHLNKITTGRKEPNIREVKDLAELFGKTWGEMAAVFLS